jgi:hypothetical protein
MYLLALLCLFPLLLAAQQTAGSMPARTDATTPAPTNPDDLCAIEGQAINAQTGEGVRNAIIILTRTDAGSSNNRPSSYTTKSDADGKFGMKEIEPGHYRLAANRNGYVNGIYGVTSPGRPGTTISLEKQQHATGLVLKLTPHGVITGRIVDEDGEPVVNAHVSLSSYHYDRGHKQLTPSGGGAGTNDLGEYRIFGVAPGKYYLSVAPNSDIPIDAIDRSPTGAASEAYVALYYPGTPDASAAAQLEVAPGGQLRGIDMRLTKTRTVHVKGHVTHAMSGRPGIQLFLSPRNFGGSYGPYRQTRADAAGNFDIPGVVAGAYTLTASGSEGNVPDQARVPIDVGSGDVEGLNLVIGPGVTIKGHMQAEGNEEGAAVDVRSVQITMVPREQTVLYFGVSPGKPDEAGMFEIRNVPAGGYTFFLWDLPEGAYVKSIRSERSDLLDAGLDLTGGAAPDQVEIVVSPKAAAVSGTVQNPKTGNAFPGATVVLVPQDAGRRDQVTFFKTTTSDQNGAFQLKGVTPGAYKAYAWEDPEPGAWMDPDFLKTFADQGESVSLQEGDRKALTLQMIPAASAGTGN